MSSCTRREFNALLIGTAASLLTGCPNTSATQVAPSSGRVFLAFSQFPALAKPGGSAVVDIEGQFPIAVVRTTAADAVALSATCTHQSCLLNYDGAANDLHCDCHGADFTLEGAVIRGPTVLPLPTYAATVQADGIDINLA